jgi:hypothetical protein
MASVITKCLPAVNAISENCFNKKFWEEFIGILDCDAMWTYMWVPAFQINYASA